MLPIKFSLERWVGEMGWQGIKPTDFALKMVEESEDHVKKVATVGLQSVITMSPVMDGAYRGNHRISLNTEDHSFSESTQDLSGNGTLTKGSSEIAKLKLGNTLYIQNNAPYAVRLENGWSDQAPTGIYSIAYMNMRTV